MPNLTDPTRTTGAQGYHVLKPVIDNTQPSSEAQVGGTAASTPDAVNDKAE